MCWGWGVGALSKSLVENRQEGQMFLYYFLGLEERLFRDAMMLIVGCLTKLAFFLLKCVPLYLKPFFPASPAVRTEKKNLS